MKPLRSRSLTRLQGTFPDGVLRDLPPHAVAALLVHADLHLSNPGRAVPPASFSRPDAVAVRGVSGTVRGRAIAAHPPTAAPLAGPDTGAKQVFRLAALLPCAMASRNEAGPVRGHWRFVQPMTMAARSTCCAPVQRKSGAHPLPTIAACGTTLLPASRVPCFGEMPPSAGRQELKYCLPESIAAMALDAGRPFLPRDPMAPAPRQRITSLYLDTPELTFLRWHQDRATDRFKLRIRAYGGGARPTLYAEVKRKTDSVVRKQRAAFPAHVLSAVIGDVDWRATPALRGHDLKAFRRLRTASAATPRVLVAGVRESLRDPHDGTAITIDRALRYQPAHRGDLQGDPRAWMPLPLPGDSADAMVLLELKFGDTLPIWMEDVIARVTPWSVSFSKYAAAMVALTQDGRPSIGPVLPDAWSGMR